MVIITFVLLSMSACGSSSTPGSGDSTTGFSRDAVKAQLAMKIYSPYQLVQSLEPYVKPVLADLNNPYATKSANKSIPGSEALPEIPGGTDIPDALPDNIINKPANEQIGEAIKIALTSLQPSMSEEVKDEIANYLVKYFMLHG